MSTELLIQGLFAGLISLMVAWIVFSRCDQEVGSDSLMEGGQKYVPFIHGALLPLYLLVFFALELVFYGAASTLEVILDLYFGIFLHICLYYIVLLPMLPLLRDHISARACAILWMLPNYLYLTQYSYMEVPKPVLVLHASSGLVKILTVVWLIGFAAVFGWHIVNHLIFRRKVLKHAAAVTDDAVLQLFREEVKDMAIRKPKFQLVQTQDAATPLSIGLFRRSTKIVLPKKDYSPHELRLIFRHELIHISREDSWSKFFMVFCTAMCWFNPLMWIAMKKSAEDLELSCDETVLLKADESERAQYAELILSTAGDDRGFSTCLSASATTMRYRLRSIVRPPKRRTGALIVGLTFFVLCMTCGYVALAYGEETGAATIFRDHDLTEFSANHVAVVGGRYESEADPVDTRALTQYLAGLHTQELIGNYPIPADGKYLEIWYNSPYGVVLVYLYTDYVKVLYLSDESDVWYVYHLPEPADWEYIDSIVPPLPTAQVDLTNGMDYSGYDLEASVMKLVRIYDGKSAVLKDRVPDPYGEAGVFGSLEYADVVIAFSMPVISEIEVLIENWDYSSSKTLVFDAAETIRFAAPDYSAHYTVKAVFQGSNGVYETTFTFHIGGTDVM